MVLPTSMRGNVTAASTATPSVLATTQRRWRSANRPRRSSPLVKRLSTGTSARPWGGFISLSAAGIKVNEKIKAASTPTEVKIPKSRIEAMLEIVREPKPAMSVSEVKITGRFIARIVAKMAWSRSRCLAHINWYSVIRWMPSATPMAIRIIGMAETTIVIGRPTRAITPNVHTSATSTTAIGISAPLTIRKETYITRSTTRMTSGMRRLKSLII